MKIILDTEQQKTALLEASEHIHFLDDVDTDIPMVNAICHMYLTPEIIEVTCKETEMQKPTVVCLCGSTRFPDAFTHAAKVETLKGKVVLSVGLFGHQEGMDMDGPVKKMLDELHLRKIDMADEVLILNREGYIGESTRRERDYALAAGKKVNYLEE